MIRFDAFVLHRRVGLVIICTLSKSRACWQRLPVAKVVWLGECIGWYACRTTLWSFIHYAIGRCLRIVLGAAARVTDRRACHSYTNTTMMSWHAKARHACAQSRGLSIAGASVSVTERQAFHSCIHTNKWAVCQRPSWMHRNLAFASTLEVAQKWCWDKDD
jgi:hypothetical protein